MNSYKFRKNLDNKRELLRQALAFEYVIAGPFETKVHKRYRRFIMHDLIKTIGLKSKWMQLPKDIREHIIKFY